MLEALASIALQLAPSVLGELVPILGEKLRQKLLSPTQEDTIPRVEIKDAEIIEKIKETLQKRDELIKDDIKNNHETMKQLIQQVLDEIKILSARTPNLEVGSDEISLSEPIQQIDKEFDSQELEARLEEIKRSLEESIAKRLTEIQTGLASQVNNIPQRVIQEPSPSEEQGSSDDNQELLPTTNVETPDSHNSPSKRISQTDNITKQVRPEPSKSEQLGNEDNKQGLSSGTNVEPPVKENSESKRMLENLRQYKEYGESVLRGLKLLPQNQSSHNEVLDNPKLRNCLEGLKDAADKTIELASSPVKIAIMGEFSSGKTLLIDSLIGYSGILPVSEIPTTGNVTAIHLLPQDDFQTTEFDNFSVEYLSEQEVQQCLQFMLEEARKRAQASELPALPQVNSKTLNEDSLNQYENWCNQAWNNTQNPELRYLLRELVIFIRTCISYGADLYGHSFEITHTTAREGLKLGGIPTANQTLSFEDIPPVPKSSLDRNRPSAELLQNSFSLIRRININVKISKEIWNLSTTQATAKFILLDFPGLGAADSGVRDTFVSLRELAQVQTILILLNAKSPGSDRANKIFTMMEQKRPGQNLKELILVGVGRFNQLPLEGEGGERKLDKLIDSAVNSSLTEETVLQILSVLKTIINNAKAFTNQQERIVLLDQLMGLADLAKRSNTVKAGSDEFLANLEYDSFLEQSKRMRQKWGGLSEQLLATDPRSSLGKQLGYFAVDGGIGKLRELIQEHVAAHSLKQLYEDTRRAANTLRQQQDQFKQILSELDISREESQALKDLRFYLDKMYSTYNRFKDNLGKEPLKDWQGVAVSDVVKDEVTYQILNWKQWTLLFGRARNGKIILAESQGAAAKLFTKNRVNSDNIPTKSDDFHKEFDKTVKKLEDFAHKRIQKAVENLLNDLANQLDAGINHLKAILHEEMGANIERKFPDKFDIFNTLYAGYNPKQWEEPIREEVFEEEMGIKPTPMFPLALADEKHDSGQIFDWAPEHSKTTSQTANHLLLVQRLRDEITASASLHLIEYVSKINKKVDQEILNILDSMTPALNELLKEDALLRYISGDEKEPSEANPISPILSQIASISTPNT